MNKADSILRGQADDGKIKKNSQLTFKKMDTLNQWSPIRKRKTWTPTNFEDDQRKIKSEETTSVGAGRNIYPIPPSTPT